MRSTECVGVDKPWSAVTLGCWQIAPSGGWGDLCTEQEAERVVKTALDIGITAFDTAEGYGDNESERRLGRALGSKKYDVVVISKVWPDAELTLSAYEERLEGTLKALGRDHVDVYLVHWPGSYFDSAEKSDQLSQIMFRLKVSGKAKAVGLSNFQATDLKLMGESVSRFIVNQVPYSLMERGYEGEARALCVERGLQYMAYSSTAVGFLAREMEPDDLQYPARNGEAWFHEPHLTHSRKVLQTVQEIANELQVKPIQVALAWVLAQENILTAIVGSRKAEQVKDLKGAGDLQLDSTQLDRLTQASDAYRQAVRSL